MAYLERSELLNMGFKHLGKDVRISSKASIYNPDQIEIGDYSRIDDFCVVSGRVSLGRNVHIAPFCLIAGGTEGVFIEDFAGLAYRVQVFSQSDDYSGGSLTNPTVPTQYKHETKEAVYLKRHVIVGAGSTIFPGVTVEEGCAIGAMTLIRESTTPWSIYFGMPARRLAPRKKDMLQFEEQYLAQTNT